MKNESAIHSAAEEIGLTLTENDQSGWYESLREAVNVLIEHDFGRLLNILYRMDVDESKIRKLLNENPGTDAATTIAQLMIERQAEKIKSRREFTQRDNNINEDEKW